MTLFYRHTIIYQAMTGPTFDEPAVVLEELSPPSTAPIVYRVPFYESLTSEVLDEIPVIESGWDQTPTTPIISRVPFYLGDWSGSVEEIPIIQSGWDQTPTTPIIRRVPFHQSLSIESDLLEPVVIVEEPGWDQAFNPPVITRVPYHLSESIEGGEVPLEEPGWDQLVAVVRRTPFFYESIATEAGVLFDVVAPPIAVRTRGLIGSGFIKRRTW